MHQPDYRDRASGEYVQPWTYLHAIKDYVDMAGHLESVPGARAVVNFSPILIEQLQDYARQTRAAVDDGDSITDPLLDALRVLPGRDARAARRMLVERCLRSNRKRLIERFPGYRRLVDLAAVIRRDPDAIEYLDDAFLADLLVWYHLAWIGETERRANSWLQMLADKRHGYTAGDRRLLLAYLAGLLGALIERYRALAADRRVELSITPYAHPMLPLLIDWGVARESEPDAPLPSGVYRDGEIRARRHLERAVEVFERAFGARPRGCWPSEGGLSTATVGLLGESGFEWTASGEGVLRGSLELCGDPAARDPDATRRVYRVDGHAPACFFRDDGLSDLIGFTFSDWHADDAVGHLIHEFEQIAARLPDPGHCVVPIILDGENAWEHYPENAYYFLHGLYQRLTEHPGLELSTFADCVDQTLPSTSLPALRAGSWVYGNFSTWIGSTDKNRGWALLAAAAEAYAEARDAGRLEAERLAAAERQLAVCEGSDWFWWLGDYNPAESVRDFERLFRHHLAQLYALLDLPAPAALGEVLSHGRGAPATGGVMRRGSE